MTDRNTAAYPGSPPKVTASHAETLHATPESSQATLIAPQGSLPTQLSSPGTTAGIPGTPGTPGTTSGTRPTLNPGRGTITVLPDVRSEGERLVLVPRDKTRYEADRLLGRGGMGEVQLAHDHDIGRKVAVKRLLDEGNTHAVARFIDEVRTVGSLEHPNIVPIHDVGVDEDGSLFFVMKYVEGETLAGIITKLAQGDAEAHRRYNFEARLEIFVGLMRALQYAHSQGLVHRDIKPENVMIGRYGEVVLMDWGIAHSIRGPQPNQVAAELPGRSTITRASNETVDGSVIGTPQYMSPEQAAGQVSELDGRSDLYSAFAVLYELLVLQPYIAEGTAIEMIVAVQERPPISGMDPIFASSPHQDVVPAELRHFLRHGLSRDREHRYASAEEVIWELERIRSGECAVECPVTFIKHNGHKFERFVDRKPQAAMAAAALGMLGFLGGVAGWIGWFLS
jgi:eukaryotic-like serine/threonine-protein kinase